MNDEETRFERLLKQHQEDLRTRGYSRWMEVGRMYSDGVETITALKNPVTGEVISNA